MAHGNSKVASELIDFTARRLVHSRHGFDLWGNREEGRGLSVVVVAGEELLQTIHCGQEV